MTLGSGGAGGTFLSERGFEIPAVSVITGETRGLWLLRLPRALPQLNP